MSQRLCFQDLQPGRVFESAAYEMTSEAIKAFASQYDPQPFHLDEEAAKNSFFQGLAASGWHTAAITMRLLVDSLPVEGGLVGAGMEHFRWFRPVRPGDRLHVKSEVLSSRLSRSKPHQGIVRVKHSTLDQNNQPVQEFVATIVVPEK